MSVCVVETISNAAVTSPVRGSTVAVAFDAGRSVRIGSPSGSSLGVTNANETPCCIADRVH